MPSCDEVGDGPTILQLQKWGNKSRFQLELSDYCEASISPTRQLLLLLSHQCEALLVPLIAGNGSIPTNKDESNMLYHEAVQEPCSLHFSPEQATLCKLDSSSDAPCGSKPGVKGSLTVNKFPVISDVKSFTWGHCGDAYSHFKGSGFSDILVVSGDNGITVHAFRHLDKSKCEMKSSPEGASLHGNWVEWGPNHCTHAKEQLSNPDIHINLCNIDSVNRTAGEQHVDGEFKDVGPSNSSSTQKKWLQTFLTEVETVLSSGKCSTRFPAESSFPQSAAVVSFSIYDSILKFFEFLSCTDPKSFGVDQNEENTPTFGLPSRVPPHFHSKDDHTEISYKCSRVFSSPSCTLLGLVLNISNTASINSDDDHSSKILVVVVVVVYDWDLQWLCSVELDKHYPGPGPNPEWADFQFSGNFLVCLTVSGLVGIWGAESGHFVTHVDVIRCSGLDSRTLSRCDRPELSRTEDSDSKVGSSGKADIKSGSDGSETCSRDLVSVRTFRKLMVASHSLLLAVMDEIGIIYVIRTDDYISEKKYKFNSFMPPSDFGTMMGWKLAGSEIVGPKVFADFSSGQVQVLDTNYIRDAEFVKSKPRTKNKEAKLDMYSSDFTTYSQVKGWNISHSVSEVSSAPMRRIFLPSEKYNKEDCICFSPFGITRFIKTRNLEERKSYKIVHTGLFVAHSAFDERYTYECFMSTSGSTKGTVFVGESIGCSFEGCLYILTQDGLSVILPSVSVSSRAPPVETIRYWQPTTVDGSKYQVKDLLEVNQHKDLWRPWQVEVLDKVLLYEGPNEAECICLKNGWDFKFARVRRMQLALHYLKIDEIEQSLNMLVDVNLAEEGILRLLFTTVYQISCKVGVENEVALASRLLALAACFATKMIHSYGLENHKNDKLILSVPKDIGVSYLQPFFPNHLVEISNSKRLNEMAYFLEVIRNLQSRLVTKSRRPGKQVSADGRDQIEIFDPEVSHEDTSLPIVTLDSVLSGMQDASEFVTKGESASTAAQLSFDNTESLSLTLTESSDMVDLHEFYGHETSHSHMRKLISVENTRDMIARWQADNLDLKSVVKDALHSGRLPLAVLQLHLQRQRELVSENEYQDIFNEVHDAGRAIAYDLFLKGESGLAMATLQRLGEDIEIVLRQLLFGTVRRSLRAQLHAEMRAYGWLRSHELKILDRISLIERLYPSSSFWGTFLARRKNIDETALICSLPEANNLKVAFNVYDNLIIECGDIDGVVIGVWTNDIGSSSSSSVCDESDDNNHTIYWACAAVWSDAWDERTMDRILLDQPFHTGVHLAWESQLEYHTSRNDLAEVYKLLDVIPTTSLSMGTLTINLNPPHSSANVGTSLNFPDYQMYICAAEDLEPVCMDIPNVKIFKSSAVHTCSSSLKMLLEQELARKYIFLKEYWDSTDEIIALLARAGSIIDTSKLSVRAESSKSSLYLDTFKIKEHSDKVNEEAVHKVVVHHCIQHNLPNLLDLYIDHHNLVLDNDSLCSLLEAAGDCQWAKWLFYSRVKGREYEASFSNARSNLSRQMTLGSNLSEIDEIIYTVDDMAEGGGEMAALATLAYATEPMQKCLCSGSVNRHCSASSQCTLENLRPALQHFPTLWRTLVATCFGHDASVYSFGPSSSNVLGRSTVTDYVNWRYSIFRSAGGDTSLIQMLPGWFPKSIRRLIKLFVQGPLGWQSLSGEEPSGESFLYSRNNYAFHAGGDVGVSAISWEATIEKSVKELYSSLKENGVGIEHHLHRGRPLAAFNHLLGVRALKLKSMNAQVSAGQSNMQSDVQTVFAPLTRTEGLLLSSVMPLAILHFEDSVLVSSCAFLLELCGLSASILRVDIAALRRISYYYNLVGQNAHSEHVPTKGSVFHALSQKSDFAISLAGALADDYVQSDHLNSLDHIDVPDKISTGKQPSRALLTVLLHLEKASLPSIDAGRSCGSWLSSGNGDGFDFRSQQKDASQQWSLVTTFCQIHCLPLSTKYLALLANDNDWVGFLTEAQLGGFPIHLIIQVAAQEFKDPRLKTHVLTVLKSMQSTRKKTSSSSSSSGRNEILFMTDSNPLVPTELFGILAECERQKNPGEALLVKAKYLSWSLLAMIASCFPDVSPLSCLTVWLEITAARETSSIHVNDISSRITNNVGAAVDATNTLPTGSRPFTFHYNRRNSKRRRIMEPSTTVPFSNFPSPVSSAVVPFAQEIASEEERKKIIHEQLKISSDSDEGLASLSNMVAVLCEQHLFLPLLRAFDMFLPSCSLLPFIRSLQAFSQMRLSEASAHLDSFSARIREEPFLMQLNMAKNGQIKTAWISSTAVKAADAMLSTCPSAYEKRCLLQLLSAADFGDGGSASTYFRRLYWKMNLAEPSLRKDDDVYLGNEILDDASLLSALEKNGHWEQARNWARQLESTSASWKSIVHHVTETQAESMVTEWKEFLWDIPEERAALWIHCQTLFQRHSFPALQAGLFFLKHAEAIEKEIPARELHEMLLFSLQWLSGTMTQSDPVCPLNLLREIETRVWLLAVESEAQSKAEGDFTLPDSVQNRAGGNNNSFIEQTAGIIAKMDNHMHAMRMRSTEKNFPRENNLLQQRYSQPSDSNSQVISASSTRTKRRTKNYMPLRRHIPDNVDINNDSDDNPNFPNTKIVNEFSKNSHFQEENIKIGASLSGWEEKMRPAELERAVLSLLEFGQITAAKQLQHKLSPEHVPSELVIVDAALKLAVLSSSSSSGEISVSMLEPNVLSIIESLDILSCNQHMVDALQVLESLTDKFDQGCGRGLCRRIISVVKAAKVLGLPFSEAFEKKPIELLQLLSLKAQDSLEEAKLLVQTHVLPPSAIARILAESFLKGLLAAHRGGYIDSQKEEGPAPLLWRFSDFLMWAELCPSEPEIGHALMRLVMTGQDIPHACEVELLILSHHFYKSSACLDGVDVLVTLAANRVESYVLEGDFSCLARLVTGVGNFHALNFIINILIENGQLQLLLQKYSSDDAATNTAEAVRGFRMAVLTSLKLFNPYDLDAFSMVYNHFDMKHETASLLESRSTLYIQQWFSRRDKDRQNEDLLEAMRHLIEVAEVLSTIDAGHKTHRACSRASLLSLQIRIPDLNWLELSETNARRAFVEQSRFQEALIVAEAYNLNQPSEWAPVLWNLMLKPDLIEQFVAEFVAVLPLQPSMLLELARFYRSEVAARGDQSHFSVWLSPGGLLAEWVKHLGRSFRCLLRRTRDLRVRVQLATIATGFFDVVDACSKVLDKVPDNAGPLILRRGHGGAYLPLM